MSDVNTEFLDALDDLEKERGISKDVKPHWPRSL